MNVLEDLYPGVPAFTEVDPSDLPPAVNAQELERALVQFVLPGLVCAMPNQSIRFEDVTESVGEPGGRTFIFPLIIG